MYDTLLRQVYRMIENDEFDSADEFVAFVQRQERILSLLVEPDGEEADKLWLELATDPENEREHLRQPSYDPSNGYTSAADGFRVHMVDGGRTEQQGKLPVKELWNGGIGDLVIRAVNPRYLLEALAGFADNTYVYIAVGKENITPIRLWAYERKALVMPMSVGSLDFYPRDHFPVITETEEAEAQRETT